MDNERLVDCPRCLDTGYEEGSKTLGGRLYTFACPCTCIRGIPMAAGYWRDVLRPEIAGKRYDSRSGMARFELFRKRSPGFAGNILDYLERNPEPLPRAKPN